MIMDQSNRSLWIQRAMLLLGVSIFLYVFRTVIPSGDALVYLRHIQEGLLVLNPNHLLMDPLAYVWCRGAAALGLPPDGIVALKLLSGLSTLLVLILFDATLVEAGVKPWLLRLAAVLGLFASRYFMTMAVSEEFFMFQMPFLVAALWILVRFVNVRDPRRRKSLLIGLGLLLAVATAISINNGLLIVFLGVALLFAMNDSWPNRLGYVLRFAASAALVGFPLFVGAYLISGSDASFLEWLTAYQGETDNPTAGLYGVELTVPGLLISLSRIGFNFFANFADFGALGTVLKVKVFGEPLEMTIDWIDAFLGAISVSLIGVAMIGFFVWIVRRGRRLLLTRLGIAWILSYCFFNLYWNDSSDQFWFQLLPVLWLLLLVYLGATSIAATDSPPRRSLALIVFVVAVPLLLVLNTVRAIGTRVFVDMEGYQQEHRALIRAGDLELIPGWDELLWLAPNDSFPAYEQLTLMDLATGRGSDGGLLIETLPELIDARLRAGNRVFVARLYDLDDNPRPWDHLRNLGWSRARIQDLLSEFTTEEVASIGGITVRELKGPAASR